MSPFLFNLYRDSIFRALSNKGGVKINGITRSTSSDTLTIVRQILRFLSSLLMRKVNNEPKYRKKYTCFREVYIQTNATYFMDQSVTNNEVLQQQRKIQYLGHMMRRKTYDLLQLLKKSKVQGKRSIERRQNSWLKDLKIQFYHLSTEVFCAVVSNATIWIAKLWKETPQ